MKKINKGVLKNIDEKAEFSNKYKNPFEPFVKKAYDLYLKKTTNLLELNRTDWLLIYLFMIISLKLDFQAHPQADF